MMKKTRFNPMKLALVGVLAIMFIFFSIVVGSSFYSLYNIMNILKSASSMGILVLGLTWVIGAGEMDCSFPEVASCTTMLFAYLLNARMDATQAMLISLCVGLACGLLTSLLVVGFKFPSLIASIATSTIAGAIANIINDSATLAIKGIKSAWMYKMFSQSVLGFPMVFVVFLVLYILALIVQEKTKFGQYVYALSENPQAVREAGIKGGLVKTVLFTFSGFMASFGGIIYVLTVYRSGQPSMGSSFFLNGFTVVFLGAMILKLGKCNVVGTFVGAMVLGSLTNGLTMLGAGFAVEQVIKGLLLILGVAVVTIYRRKTIPKGRKMKYE